MKSVLYIGCPATERADTEQLLASADLSVVWADNSAGAVAELQRKTDMPVLLDLSRGAAALVWCVPRGHVVGLLYCGCGTERLRGLPGGVWFSSSGCSLA